MFVKRLPLAMWLSVLSIGFAGCGGSGGGGSSLAQREVVAPDSAVSGGALQWQTALGAGEQAQATIYDAQNTVVFHRDLAADGDFQWTPFQPGTYLINVGVSDGTGPIAAGQALVEITPRGGPLVTGTSHPLVALYTFEIPAGRTGNVTYTCDSCVDTVARTFETPKLEGNGSEVGVLLPGLRPSSGYTVQHTIYDGTTVESRGPELSYASGAIPVALPTVEVLSAPVNPGLNSLLAVAPISGFQVIVDENATPVWYTSGTETLLRPTGNGWTLIRSAYELGIVDYTGQSIQSTTTAALNLQLVERGFTPTATFHHEIRPLPNRRYAILGTSEKLVTDVQGPGTVDVLADTVIVVDDQMRVVWTWDAFDHMDVSRAARLGDVVENGFLGIQLQFAEEANDWTHMNSIDYDPADGNLILSVRHQSWVIKIAYENGTGDGHIVWRLGVGGDFTIVSDDPLPWFSYQHDANLLPDGRLAVYDNGNARIEETGEGNSRGQVYILDEVSRIAVLDVNIDLGVYSFFLGSAALTPDGSYHFNSGGQGLHDSIAADGVLHSSFRTTDQFTYRSFRMSNPFDTSSN